MAFVVATAFASIGTTGCMVGERPSFEQAPTAAGALTGDPSIDSVLSLLDSVDSAVFSASYQALVVFNGVASSVTAAQASSTQRSMTIGDVRYVTDQNGTRTCSVAAGSCTPVLNAAAVSDTGVTPEFVFGDVARRLRRDANARIGPSVASTREVAGEQATCVDVPLSGGTKQYCALSNGVLARFVGADVTVDMTSYQRIVDPTLFTP
ncbi:MAG: hypothetical protein WCP59_00780 [Actinomycetota bacterium]